MKDSSKVNDVTKKMEFDSSTIRNFIDQEHFEASDDTEQNQQMEPQ